MGIDFRPRLKFMTCYMKISLQLSFRFYVHYIDKCLSLPVLYFTGTIIQARPILVDLHVHDARSPCR